MTAPATCEPPPEHRGVEWHWLRHEPTQILIRVRWVSERRAYFSGDRHWSAAETYGCGYRYVGPARPPQEGE
jgi:hypothetical protein